MKKLLIIMLVIAALTVITATITIIKRRQRRAADKLSAAAILLREDILDKRIARDYSSSGDRFMPVLHMSWHDGGYKSYVLNPGKPIRIGRDIAANKISIRRDSVSSEHCRLDMQNGQLVLTDLDSKNGTFLKRGFSKYRIQGSVYVYSGDEIEVGGLSIKLDMFMYDTAYIS